MALSQIASRFSFAANCDLFRTKYSGLPVGMGGRRALFSHPVSLSLRVSSDSRRMESLVSNASVVGAAEVGTVVIEGPGLAPSHVLAGGPLPLGATACDGGVNFAIYSSCATAAVLCLFTISDLKTNRVTEEVVLDPLVNKTGDVWHVFLQGEFENMLYGYKFDGKRSPEKGHYFDFSRILLDPYAKAVISREEYGIPGPGGDCWPQMAGMIPVLKNEELGINCIELMPCQEFNELEYFSHNSVLGENKLNFWGYSTINYFSPMIRYSSVGASNCGLDAINEFKTFVREAHKRGIEVLLDVVFNHTAEGNENGPIFSFRGIDNSTYYMLAPKGEFYNYSGCGNTFNCNHPVNNRYWATEMHIDGFRFDLASIMTRGCSLCDPVNVFGKPIEGDMLTTGAPLNSPSLIEMISNDPILSKVKLIAEAWDAGGLYQVGSFPHFGIWSEWNGKVRTLSHASLECLNL
ncbi:hypothetical protein ZIOFF_069940 [Zingiber officinale]|uniref:Glycoside hydrolase family 13 N-terminal domain-containing protein n=1 Tax=Zingiber officinale TaxID=94328 RepID=A0A8J5EUB8_ZINOF|nr:hypothetical protein ZIOFF_069940 [Zingiber officinale]